MTGPSKVHKHTAGTVLVRSMVVSCAFPFYTLRGTTVALVARTVLPVVCSSNGWASDVLGCTCT
jgi:hypothetical protein